MECGLVYLIWKDKEVPAMTDSMSSAKDVPGRYEMYRRE